MSQTLHLKIFHNDQLVEQKTLAQDVIKIGKLKSSHLCLEDDSVARMHAVIEVAGSDVRVIDLGSSTGTFLNGHRVEKNAVLKQGDVLSFGPYRVEVSFAEAAAVVPTSVPTAVSSSPGMPAAAAPAAAMAAAVPAASRPVMHIDPSDVERQDGTNVAEVMALYGRTVLDVQHVGQVQGRRGSAPLFMAIGGLVMLAGVGLFAYEVGQNWEEYDKQLRAAEADGQVRPAEPGAGTGGLGLALALLGIVPFTIGLVRSQDRALTNYTIGEGRDATFHTPTAGLPDPDGFPLVRYGSHGDAVLQFSANMTGDVMLEGQRVTLAELVSSGRAGASGGAYAFPLPPGAYCRVQHNGLTFHVNSVPPGKVLADRGEVDKPFWLYNIASLSVIGSLLVLTHLIPDDLLGLNLDDLENENRFVGYLNQPDELPEEEPPPEEDANSDDEAGGTGQRHKGEEGKMGKPTASAKSGLYAMKGPKDAVPQMARDFDPDMMARQAGILGMIQSEQGHFLASPYGGAFAVGNDDEDVWGGLTGTEIGEAHGAGGLGLVGTGRGGGGTGEGTIGLGNVGTIGKGGGGGSGSGYGRGAGAGFGGKGKRVPKVRQATANVKGAMDKDIIRRIVRAHINEVRYCYNQGLARDPNLKGRVSIQFTIGPTGTVPVAVVQQSSISDRNVANCVAQAVKRWKFPRPQGGGNVVVTYPFVLEPG